MCELIVLPRLLARILERARRAGFVCDTFAQAIIKWGTRLCTPIATKSNAFGTGAPEFAPLDRLAAKVCFLVAVCPAIFCRIVGAHKLRLCSSPRGVFHSPAQQRQPDVMPCGERDRHSFLRAAPSCTSSITRLVTAMQATAVVIPGDSVQTKQSVAPCYPPRDARPRRTTRSSCCSWHVCVCTLVLRPLA